MSEPVQGYVELKNRTSRFSYQCNRCNRCCSGKTIPLNPYDLIRLSEMLDISTGELIEKYTVEGVALKNRADGACTFLGPDGCTVHSGRPAPCRVYPLGRIVNSKGEYFCEVEPHPQTEGDYGTSGTVEDYLLGQGAEPYFKAIDAYLALFNEISSVLSEVTEPLEPSEPLSEPHLFDVDALNREYCTTRGIPEPSTSEERLTCHLRAIREWIDRERAATETTHALI